METNYTPIDVGKLEKKGDGLNTVLLLIVTFTALVLAVMLFVLIQRRLGKTLIQIPDILSPKTPSPTSIVLPTTVPTTLPTEPVASISGQ